MVQSRYKYMEVRCMKKVYSTREEYLPGYPIKDGGGWYTTV